MLIALLLMASCKGGNPDGQLILIAADPGKGFNFPYYLFLPDHTPREDTLCLIIEPNNSGFASDDGDRHLEKAERTATRDFYIGNYLAVNMRLPLLVPVFPRRERQWQVYTHALDRDVMLQKGTDTERPDLQLLAMADDARERLQAMGYLTRARYLLCGFSASGTFANRFAALHPGKLKAVAAGGVNGLLFLPVEESGGRQLPYPIGTADFQEIAGKPFDEQAFKALPQFLYMGSLDSNDAIPYADAFSPEEQALIYRTLGEEMLPRRWENCRAIYRQQGVNARIETFEGVGHEQPESVKQAILEFFRQQSEPP